MKKTRLRVAYIGGGSRQWARGIMADFALETKLEGEVWLYDIDHPAAQDNQKIGTLYQEHENAVGNWTYHYAKTLDIALKDADIVLISIMPATFKEMVVYGHHPEKYGIYQSVADTTGPAGVMRGLISIPIFVDFAKAIERQCPNAWVINFTNPMTLCLQALYEGFPKIKTFGNCHEVFGSQHDLAKIYNAHKGEELAKREDVDITVAGINHFTWITKMSCFGEDIAPLYDEHVKKVGDPDYEKDPGRFKRIAPFGSEGKIKYDLYRRYNCMAAAGDRHLAEFLPVAYYLQDEKTRDHFKFNLTPVQWRIDNLERAIKKTKAIVAGEQDIHLNKSGEEGLRQIKALYGYEKLITNVNMINKGQIEGLPLGQVVESNALFRYDSVEPIHSGKLPPAVESMVRRHMDNHNLVMESYRNKDFTYAIQALAQDPLCGHLSFADVEKMFYEMKDQIGSYLDYYQS
jgi:galacturan 1,4-alpha-galacturonidase